MILTLPLVSGKMMIYIKINLFVCLITTYSGHLLTLSECFTWTCRDGQPTAVESDFGDSLNRRGSQRYKAGPGSCQAKPGHASSTEGFSAAGHWGEGAWHLISYHSEFCSCHWHLATEKQSRDDGCCWTQLGFHVTVAVPLYQSASRLIQNDIPLQTSVPVAHYKNPRRKWCKTKSMVALWEYHFEFTFIFAPHDPRCVFPPVSLESKSSCGPWKAPAKRGLKSPVSFQKNSMSPSPKV